MRHLHDKDADIVYLSYKIGAAKTKLWQPGLPVPECFAKPEGYHFYAFNAQFDWAVTNILGTRYGFGKQILSQITDVMALCGRYSYPQALGRAAPALRLPLGKDIRGKALMRKICVPKDQVTATKREMVEFAQYCIRDTDVLYMMLHALPSSELSSSERAVWEQTVRMNMRGLPIDTAAVTRISEVIDYYLKTRSKVMPTLTDGAVNTPGQIQAIIKFCSTHGVPLDNLQKATVAEVLECDDTPPKVRKVLKLRKELSGAAIKKYKALRRMVHRGYIYDNLRYWGAGPGRFAGMGFQAQNLPRAKVKDPNSAIAKFYDTTILKEQPLEVAKGLIRPMIRAPKGYELLAADYSSIEHILLMWWAGETDAVERFRNHICPYKTSAATRLGKSYDDITGQERTEEKPVVLGAGYVMGPDALIDYAAGFGVSLSHADAKYSIDNWRSRNPMVVNSWNILKSCTIKAVRYPGSTQEYKGTTFRMVKDRSGVRWLRMTINSGRSIFYCKPKVDQGKYGDVISHLGLNTKTKQWTKLWFPPNRIIENIIQGLGRDVMNYGITQLEYAGYNPIMSVHDEIICMLPKGKGSLEKMIELMCRREPWLKDMPLYADGWVGERYRK